MGHAFGYTALAIELLAYAGQMVLLPRISKQYGTVTLTSMYYTVAAAATAATLVVREHDDLGQVLRFSLLLFHASLVHVVRQRVRCELSMCSK